MFYGIEVTLPIGIEKDGKLFKTVLVDKMRSCDHENLSTKICKENTHKGNSILISRVIQEIPGVLPRKQDSSSFIPDELVKNMVEVDRQSILQMGILTQNKNTLANVEPVCQRCWRKHPSQTVDLKTAKINKEFLEGTPLSFQFTLEEGFRRQLEGQPNPDVFKTGTLRFPRGADMEEIGSVDNEGEMLRRLLYRCAKFDGFNPTPEQFKMLSSTDMAKLFKLFDKIPKYDLSVRVKCRCGANVKAVADYSDFFDPSMDEEETDD